MIAQHISELIGNTPLLHIPHAKHGIANLDLYCKLEYLNPFGSQKDRPAWYFLKHHLDKICHDKKIIEASSGNTIKALSLL